MTSVFEIQSLLGRFALFAIPFGVAAIVYSVAVILREPEPARLTWTLVAFVLALVGVLTFLLVGWLRRRSNAGKLEDGLAAGSARGNSRGEVEALRKSWKDSVAKLRTTSVAGGGKNAFAAFPWFVIIGAPASGKSTLLRQSGLDFPVGDAAIRGLQGTRNCDWWFSNVGIFLDTAGRYISDESAEEWAQFLDLVRRGRAGAPINGVVVAIPATDLLQRSAEETDLEARRIRARLDELIDHLGVNFPVWIVVTKVDLIGGFVEFFGQADAATRQQMMGWTVGEDEGARFDLPNFERRFASTIHRLREIRPAMIEIARLRDRPAAFGFPDELAAIGDPLGRMLQRIFEPNVYQETPLYRGVYVTSATQQGTPLQRAAARVREMLGSPAEPEPTGAVIRNAYFVKDLMHERIVRDREMTWTTPREMERGKLKRLGINLIGCAVGVFLLLLVLASGLSASSELGEVEKQVGSLGSAKSGAVGRCDALWRAASHASDSNYRNLGLSQQRSLKEDLLARQREVYVESVLRASVRQWRDDLAGAPVDRGIAAATETYRQFLEFEAALAKAAKRDEPGEAPPPGKEPGPGDEEEDEDGEETAAPDPKAPPAAKEEPAGDRAPKGFFSPSQRAAVEARLERLKAGGIVGTRKADRTPDPLLDAVWRNRGGAAEVAEDARSVHDAFRAKVAEWVAKAGSAATSLQSDARERSAYVASLRQGFETECNSFLGQLEPRKLRYEDLVRSLEALGDAAAGGTAAGEGSNAARDALLDSIGPGLAAVADPKSPLVPAEALRAMPGFDAVSGWAGAGKGGGASDADTATHAALTALAQKLRELVEKQRAGDLVTRPWPAERAEEVRTAIDAIDADVAAKEKVWLAEVVPHLAVLAGTDREKYLADPERWGLAVELIEPVLRRNAAFRRFVGEDRPGTWKRIARRIVQERRSEFTRTHLSQDLEKLLGAAAAARTEDLRRFVCPETAEAAAEAARKQFQVLVEAATAYWDDQCRSLPRYKGSDPSGYIERWVNTGGEVAKLAKDLRAAFGNWELDPSLRTREMEPLARDAWALVEPMRKRYEFYTAEYEDLRTSLGTLYNRSSWSPPSDLAKVAAEFGTTRPAWRTPSLEQIPAEALGDALRKDLLQAVENAEDELVLKIEKYFDRRWENVRRGLKQAIEESSKELAETGAREFEELVADLAKLFGDGLTDEPGGRLRVSNGFRATRTSIPDPKSLGKKVARALTVEFTNRRLPVRKGGDGGVDLPLMELEYKEEGAEAAKRLWWPGKPDVFPVKWTPGRGVYVRLTMRNEAQNKSAVFFEWTGPACMVEAIRAGGGSDSLTWTGRGEWRDATPAVIGMSSSDPEALRDLLNPDTTDPASRRAADCVESLERR